MKISTNAIAWIIIITCTLFNIGAAAYFITGITAGFNRGLDILATSQVIMIWIPTLILTLVSVILSILCWHSSKAIHPVIYIIVLISIFLSIMLITSVNPEGWLTEIVRSDTLRVTSDNQYEYKLDVINLFQKNSFARLYTKKLSTGEEKSIPIGIQTNKIIVLTTTHGQDEFWILMEPTDIADKYIVETTERLNRNLYEVFEVNMVTEDVKRIH